MVQLYIMVGTVAALLFVAWLIQWNRYSGSLYVIFSGLILWGAWNISKGTMWGLVPFIIGGTLMGMGIKGPKTDTASPIEKRWLMTYKGKQTDVEVDKITLVMDWPGDIVSFIEIKLEKVDYDFKLKKKIKCTDGNYVDGILSTTMMADDRADPAGTPNGKTGGQKLQDFVNMGGIEGAKRQIDDTFTGWLEWFGKYHYSSEDMETKSNEISRELLAKMKTGRDPSHNTDNDIDDIVGLGLRFFKFQLVLTVDGKIVDARIAQTTEREQRKGELEETETVNEQVAKRIELYRKNGEKITVTQARKQIFDERLERAGKYTKAVNEGGMNVQNLPPTT